MVGRVRKIGPLPRPPGEADDEHRAVVHLAVHGDVAAMLASDALSDGEPQTSAPGFAGPVAAIESLEDVRKVAPSDTNAGVPHQNLRKAAGAAQR